MASSGRSAEHAKALNLFVKGLQDPTKMAAAKRHPLLKPILAKLSDDDIKTMQTMAQNAQDSVCPPGSGNSASKTKS